jgi:hypothetical protein
MAVRFEYDAEQQLLLLTFDGELRDETLVQAYRTARRFAAKHEIKRGILDGTKIESFSVSAETVQSLAHHQTMFPEDSDRCIVVSQDYLFGMARMYQLLGGESRDKLRVVRSLDEAYAHLKMDPPANLQLLEE